MKSLVASTGDAMTIVSSFMLQLANVQFSQLQTSNADLLILESGLNSRFASPTLSGTELTALATAGKTAVGYVNVAVTDHNRTYWDDGFVAFSDASERDVGTINASAPSWLQNNFGEVDFAPEPPGQPPAPEGFIVDFTDSLWQDIVIQQAVEVVSAGYGGVFLDDVGRYFEAGYFNDPNQFDRTLADAMMQFVVDISAAIRLVDGDAFVVINSDPFIGFNSTLGGAGAGFAAYDQTIDAALSENQFESELVEPGTGSISLAQQVFNHAQVLALENASLSDVEIGKLLEFSGANGVLSYIAQSEAYDAFAQSPKIGTTGGDTLIASNDASILGGLGGNDVMFGGNASDLIFGHAGNDRLDGGSGADRMFGGIGDDNYYVERTSDTTIELAGQGNDRVFSLGSYALTAGQEIEFLSTTNTAGTGAINLTGNAFDQTIRGNNGSNALNGLGGNDVFDGLFGDDRYYVDSNSDVVIEAVGRGNDRILASASYSMTTGVSVETLSTQNAVGTLGIKLYGNEFAQTVQGNFGANTLNGRGGADILTGLQGSDIFEFTTAFGAGNIDQITDFNVIDDTINIAQSILAGFTHTGTLFAQEFFASTLGIASSATHRFIYDTDDGKLFYDADGVGGAAGVEFATLSTGLAMTNADFFVI
jgi:uncharacterized protein (TIGR01370 family)